MAFRDQAIDLAMLTDGDVRELVGGDVELEPAVRRMRDLAKPLVKGWATGVVGLRGGGTPGRTLLASGRDGSGDGAPAGERSLPALRGDGPVTPTLEAMGPSPSVGRASRLLTGFTRAVVRGGKIKAKSTSVAPPPLPAASMGGEDAGRLERAKQKIHGILLTYPPPLRQFPAVRRLGDAGCGGRGRWRWS